MRRGSEPLLFRELIGDRDGKLEAALAAARTFLAETPNTRLLEHVGATLPIPQACFPDKRWFQRSFGRSASLRSDDLLAGKGLFYVTERGKLLLDCTAGHYQMTWGYDHPELTALLLDGIARGIVWDNHSNIPQAPVKRLSARLVELANPRTRLTRLHADPDRLNTVLLGTATGSVACAAAMKIMLINHERSKPRAGPPVFIVLDGNYHGTDFFAQRLRGMWMRYFSNVEVVSVQPNDGEELEAAFRQGGERVAGFWAEPVMMNREAITLTPEYLRLARALCDAHGALLAMDEIQTGFWYPEVIYTRRCGIEPDFVVLGKGMTAGLHPLSALVYRGRLDLLEQYDAISTNGNAALAAYIGLGGIALIERHARHIARVGEAWHQALGGLVQEFPGLLLEARGAGHLAGLKFHRVDDALAFHRAALQRGLWMRAHVYHEGHSTVLSKFALLLDDEVMGFTIAAMRELLAKQATPRSRRGPGAGRSAP